MYYPSERAFPDYRPVVAPRPPSAQLPAGSTRLREARDNSVRCSACVRRPSCMPADLSPHDLARLDSILGTTRDVRRGEALYRAYDTFQSIYLVFAGSFKIVTAHGDGLAQVTGLKISGDVMGLDGLLGRSHVGDAVALENSKVCVIPFAPLQAMCNEVRSMQDHLYWLLGSEIQKRSRLSVLLGTLNAEQRVATLLLSLSRRYKARGYADDEFPLRMTRDDIGSYLGLKLETVSRMFSKFKALGFIETCGGKTIRIRDFDGLARILSITARAHSTAAQACDDSFLLRPVSRPVLPR